MCWHALDQALDLVDRGGLDGNGDRWRAGRDDVRRALLAKAWDAQVGAFTGTPGGGDIDAGALIAPLVGFLPASDPRCRSTRQVVTERLGRCPEWSRTLDTRDVLRLRAHKSR